MQKDRHIYVLLLPKADTRKCKRQDATIVRQRRSPESLLHTSLRRVASTFEAHTVAEYRRRVCALSPLLPSCPIAALQDHPATTHVLRHMRQQQFADVMNHRCPKCRLTECCCECDLSRMYPWVWPRLRRAYHRLMSQRLAHNHFL